ncbi:MAG: hypothetical protein EOO12_07610 [Chitinophagaceae bacterium]|nr:MAG: hypothetical protein EOO12_07610 [Chitinophagaceae bacterium]
MPPRKNPPRKTTPAKTTARAPRAIKSAPRKPARKKKKPLNWKRLLLPGISLLIVVFAVIRVLGYYSDEQRRALHGPIDKHPAAARARVLASSGRKSKRVQYEFVYKGTAYQNWQNDYNEAFRVSRCYSVRLDSTNPMRSYLVEGTEGACE